MVEFKLMSRHVNRDDLQQLEVLGKLLWSKNRNLTSTSLEMVIEAVRHDWQYQILEIHLVSAFNLWLLFKCQMKGNMET